MNDSGLGLAENRLSSLSGLNGLKNEWYPLTLTVIALSKSCNDDAPLKRHVPDIPYSEFT